MTVLFKTGHYIGLFSTLVLLGAMPAVRAQETDNGLRSQLDSIWGRIFNDEKDPPQGSRGDLCAIAPAVPGPEISMLWHEQPVIVWQSGDVAKVALQHSATAEPFWEYAPSEDETYVVYDGEPLESGVTYTLALHQFASAGPTWIPRFQLLDMAERTAINDDLDAFYRPNESTASDDEWTAIQQADYFSLENRPFDAIQALFKVDQPSADLLVLQAQMIEQACTTPEE